MGHHSCVEMGDQRAWKIVRSRVKAKTPPRQDRAEGAGDFARSILHRIAISIFGTGPTYPKIRGMWANGPVAFLKQRA